MNRRKDGRWRKSVYINGNAVYFYSTAENKKDAEKEIAKKMLAYKETEHTKKHNFFSIAEQAVESRDIRHSTVECYKYALKHLEPLYELNIEDIKASTVQQILDEMSNQNYSFSAISKAKTLFGVILNFAIVKKELPLINFTKEIKMPQNASRKKVSAPSDEVICLIKDMALKQKYGGFFEEWAVSLYFTGMRRGELLAIQRKDVDLDRGWIHINKAVEFVHNKPQIKQPKTESGNRSVPILDLYKPTITNLCDGLKKDDFIFGIDKPLTEAAIKKRWKKFCSHIGFDFNMHQLRHAYAKLLYESGVDPKTAQGILGHSNFKVTMDIYTDFSKTMIDSATKKINSFLTPF